jgi:hypothetical protein
MKYEIQISLACGFLIFCVQGLAQTPERDAQSNIAAGSAIVGSQFLALANSPAGVLTALSLAEQPPFKDTPNPGGFPKIVKQPPSNLIAEEGTFIEFHVKAQNKGEPMAFQWQRNEGKTNSVWADVMDATNQTFWLDHVQFENVASYQVKVSGIDGYILSQMLHLTVFRLYHTNSLAGVGQTPIMAFSTSLGVTCDGVAFTRGWVATNDYGGLGFFYGRGFSPQYSPFINPGYPLLDANTLSSGNLPASTGIKIRKNFAPGDDLVCAGTHAPNSGAITGAQSLVDAKNYRITILCDSATPSSGKVTYNWLYHD